MTPTLTKRKSAASAITGPFLISFVKPVKHLRVHTALVLAGGLAMFLFARELGGGERAAELELTALKAAFLVALALGFFHSWGRQDGRPGVSSDGGAR